MVRDSRSASKPDPLTRPQTTAKPATVSHPVRKGAKSSLRGDRKVGEEPRAAANGRLEDRRKPRVHTPVRGAHESNGASAAPVNMKGKTNAKSYATLNKSKEEKKPKYIMKKSPAAEKKKTTATASTPETKGVAPTNPIMAYMEEKHNEPSGKREEPQQSLTSLAQEEQKLLRSPLSPPEETVLPNKKDAEGREEGQRKRDEARRVEELRKQKEEEEELQRKNEAAKRAEEEEQRRREEELRKKKEEDEARTRAEAEAKTKKEEEARRRAATEALTGNFTLIARYSPNSPLQ